MTAQVTQVLCGGEVNLPRPETSRRPASPPPSPRTQTLACKGVLAGALRSSIVLSGVLDEFACLGRGLSLLGCVEARSSVCMTYLLPLAVLSTSSFHPYLDLKRHWRVDTLDPATTYISVSNCSKNRAIHRVPSGLAVPNQGSGFPVPLTVSRVSSRSNRELSVSAVLFSPPGSISPEEGNEMPV